MACRLPGGINSPQRLWQELLRGADFIDGVPPDRWAVESDEHGVHDYNAYGHDPGFATVTPQRGAFLDNVGGFDADFFGIADADAIAIDPQHRLLLEASWEAVEHAGLDPEALARTQTGVFVGLSHSAYQSRVTECVTDAGADLVAHSASSFASGRVSQALGLHGPAVTLDTACSSGLMAVHQACRSVQVGESDLALAGGVSVMLEPHRAGPGALPAVASPTGKSRAFDVDADGVVHGEGCVMMLLKRLPDALSDGDRVLAVLLGSASNHQGRLCPDAASPESAQVAVYRAALEAAGIAANTVGLVEADGAGAPLEDQVEYAGLTKVYGTDDQCFLGSVKSNFGHCQAASGPLGLMKAILALQHGMAPVNPNFTRLPEQLTSIQTHLIVPQQNTAWENQDGSPRRAAVSSYGASGTNVHIVVEQAPISVPGSASTEIPGPLLFPLSATSEPQLRATAQRLGDWLDEHDTAMNLPGLADLAYTLARRGHRPIRTAIAADSIDELGATLREIALTGLPHPPALGSGRAGPVWVFSGAVPQWTQVTGLLSQEPAFAAAIARMEPVVAAEAGFSLIEAMSTSQPPTDVTRMQAIAFASQVGIAEAMKSYGLRPAAVIGHSLGEVAAAVVAGGLNLQDGLRVICRRSRLLSNLAEPGAMAIVEMPAQQVLSELSIRDIADVALAVVDSPVTTIISGAAETVQELVTSWRKQGVPAQETAGDFAAHSPLMESALDEFARALSDLEPAEADVAYYSATLWAPRDRPSFDANYWVENLRYTSRFAAAVQAAIKDGHCIFGELTAHTLRGEAIEHNARSLDTAVAVLVAGQPAHRAGQWPGLRGFVADLYSAGAEVEFGVQHPAGRLLEAPLPVWNHRTLLLSREVAETTAETVAVRAVHPLLGSHVQLWEEPERHVWQAEFGTEENAWPADLSVLGATALAEAFYCEMALAAAHVALGGSAEVHELRFDNTIDGDRPTLLCSAATATFPGVWNFSVHTQCGRIRTIGAVAVLQAVQDFQQPPAVDIAALLASPRTRLDHDARSQELASHDGAVSRFLKSVVTCDDPHDGRAAVLAELALPRAVRAQQTGYEVHPLIWQACLQAAALHPDLPGAGVGALLRPTAVGRLRRHGPSQTARYCRARVTAAGTVGCQADVELLDAAGEVLLTVEGLRFARNPSQDSLAKSTLDERLLTSEWEAYEPPTAGNDGGNWLLLSMAESTDSLRELLESELKHAGGQAESVSWAEGYRMDGLAAAIEGCTGIVVLLAPRTAGVDPTERARECVKQILDLVGLVATVPGDTPQMFVVTRAAATVRPDDVANLNQAGLRGLIRVAAAEYPHLRIAQIDVDSAAGHDDKADDDKAEELLASRLAAQLRNGCEEDETAWREDVWYRARLRRGPLRNTEKRTTVIEYGLDGMRLQWQDATAVESCQAIAQPRTAPGYGQIEVAVVAWAANSVPDCSGDDKRDAQGNASSRNLGFAGVVVAVGPEVVLHRVGDYVGGIAPDDCLSTFWTCDERCAAALPAGMVLSEAAAIPTAYASAWYGLHELARITASDKVLIHGASSVLGQAAIAIARAAGSDISATAASADERQILHDLGIDNIYDWPQPDFADVIDSETGGAGVDIVLNAQPGFAHRGGLDVVGVGGRFVELAPAHSNAGSRLELAAFGRNVSFHIVDLPRLAQSRPEVVARLLTTVYHHTVDAALPLPTCTHDPFVDAAVALRRDGYRNRCEIAVLDVPQSGSTVAVVPPEQTPLSCADGAYIVTDGVRGPGLVLAGEIGANCGRLILHGQSTPDSAAQRVIENLRAGGVDVRVECADIADPLTARRLVALATESGLRVRGVLHAIAAPGDSALDELTAEMIDSCWTPKVRGAWNLHQALQEHEAVEPLDWFCVFSSAAALLGPPGQSASAAATSWLEAFGYWRRSQGLSATVIAWWPWRSEGGLAEASYALRTLLSYDRPYSGYVPANETVVLTELARRSRFASDFRSSRDTAPDAQRLLSELQDVPQQGWLDVVVRTVSEQISVLIRRAVEPDRALPEYGLDSVSSLEFRTRIELVTGVRVGPAQLTTVRAVAQYVCDQLMAQAEARDGGGLQPTGLP